MPNIDPDILKKIQELQAVNAPAGGRDYGQMGMGMPEINTPVNSPVQPKQSDPHINNMIKVALALGLNILNRATTRPIGQYAPYGGSVPQQQPPLLLTGLQAVSAIRQKDKQKEADAAAAAEAQRKADLEERRMRVAESTAESNAGYKTAQTELAGRKFTLAEKDYLRKQGLTDAQIANMEWDNLHPRPSYPPNYIMNPPGKMTEEDLWNKILQAKTQFSTPEGLAWYDKFNQAVQSGDGAALTALQSEAAKLPATYAGGIAGVETMPADDQAVASALINLIIAYGQAGQSPVGSQPTTGGGGGAQADPLGLGF